MRLQGRLAEDVFDGADSTVCTKGSSSREEGKKTGKVVEGPEC